MRKPNTRILRYIRTSLSTCRRLLCTTIPPCSARIKTYPYMYIFVSQTAAAVSTIDGTSGDTTTQATSTSTAVSTGTMHWPWTDKTTQLTTTSSEESTVVDTTTQGTTSTDDTTTAETTSAGFVTTGTTHDYSDRMSQTLVKR